MQAVTITQITPPELETLINNSIKKALIDYAQFNQSQPADHWYDLDGLCNYLAEKPAKATVYGWVSKGEIPHHKRSKKLYFLKSQIDLWLKAGRKKTTSEIEAEADEYLHAQKRKTSRV